MSKGLDYLAAKRPKAMSGLLQFYGKSVQALDDKTRLLISVVTKVATGTERGLRQYAPQAVKAGASKEELLDAVLMAFPAAGLTRVVDAVHILLDMGLLPSLSSEQEPQGAKEIVLGNTEEFEIGKMHPVSTEKGAMIVYRSADDVFKLYSAVCPHAKGNLGDGTCDGTVIECPVHHWTFNLETGDNTQSKRAPLIKIPSKIENGKILAIV